MKKLLNMLPIVLILITVFTMAVSAGSATAYLSSSSYYATSSKVLGYYARMAAYNSGSSLGTDSILYIIGSKGQELKDGCYLEPGISYSGARKTDSIYGDTMQFNWYTYLQPHNSSSGKGAIGSATVYANY